jgi:hypothetical protein
LSESETHRGLAADAGGDMAEKGVREAGMMGFASLNPSYSYGGATEASAWVSALGLSGLVR